MRMDARKLETQSPESIFDELSARSFDAVHLAVPPGRSESLDSFLRVARDRRFAVHASLVLARRSSQLVSNLSPVNAFGEADLTALCPSQPKVQELFIEDCTRVAGHYPWESLELEALGFVGRGQDFYHSICFCAACQYGYGAVGAILEQVAREEPAPSVEHPSVKTMLLWRRSVQYGLLQQIQAAVSVPICLRTAASLRFTGDKSSLTFEEARGLADFCTVSFAGMDKEQTAQEIERLAAMPRPMPVYGIDSPEHAMFAGYIFNS